MRKVIAAFNFTLDGSWSHTEMIADEELHQHYNELLKNGGVMLYGRTTYQLMESYWPLVVKDPTGDKATDDFALLMEELPKVVFSRTLKSVEWKTARLAKKELKDEVLELRQQEGKDILVGSRSLIIALMNLNLIDEYQFCVQPTVSGSGATRFFNGINKRIGLTLMKTKAMGSGSVVFYYKPAGANE